MNDILLAQPVLEDSWIDLSVGEPHLIRENLLSTIDINKCLPRLLSNDFIYPSPCGAPELVEYLESKYGGKVIITNGAKQGIGACFYAIKQMKKEFIRMRTPHWALIPPLAEMHNVHIIPSQHDTISDSIGTELVLAPNNPDGFVGNLEDKYKQCQDNNVLMVHDAAYYTPIYLGADYDFKSIGDVQIYSISKMLGLSSLRLGFVVCHNLEMYSHIQNYMENMTVGVSKLPQMFLLNIFNALEGSMEIFEKQCFNELRKNKESIKQINSSILDINPQIENIVGMFLWAKCNDFQAFKRAKLHIINGKYFGNKDFVRINLGFPNKTIKEIVERLQNI